MERRTHKILSACLVGFYSCAMSVQAYGKAESDKRYEVVVKHCAKGVLHMAYFDELNKAHTWLMARWAEEFKAADARDGLDRASFQSSHGGAIYDQHKARERVPGVLGADYVTKES
jgi:hypothetical protein